MRHALIVMAWVVLASSYATAANILIVRPAGYEYGALIESGVRASLEGHNIITVDFSGVPRRKIERVIYKKRRVIIVALGAQALRQADFLDRPIFYAGVINPPEYRGREITGIKVNMGHPEVLKKTCPMGFPVIGTVYVDEAEGFGFEDIGFENMKEKGGGPDLVEEVMNCEATDPQILGVRAFGEQAVYPAVTRVIKALAEMGGAFWIPPDSDIYNPELVHWILLECKLHAVPVIGFTPVLLEFGALAVLTPDPVEQGRQLAGLIERYLERGKIPHRRYAHIKMRMDPEVAKIFNVEKFIANKK